MIEWNGQCKKKNAYVDHLRHGLLEPKNRKKKMCRGNVLSPSEIKKKTRKNRIKQTKCLKTYIWWPRWQPTETSVNRLLVAGLQIINFCHY